MSFQHAADVSRSVGCLVGLALGMPPVRHLKAG